MNATQEKRITGLRQDLYVSYLSACSGAICSDEEAAEYLAKKTELGDLVIAKMDERRKEA